MIVVRFLLMVYGILYCYVEYNVFRFFFKRVFNLIDLIYYCKN